MSCLHSSAASTSPAVIASTAPAAAVVAASAAAASSSTLVAQQQPHSSAAMANLSAVVATDADALAQLPSAAAVPAPPLFVDVPASRLLRLPAALLLKLANEFLEDEDAQRLAQTCSATPPLLRSCRIQSVVSLQHALRPWHSLSVQLSALSPFVRLLVSRPLGQAGMDEMDDWLARMRFGVPTASFIDTAASMDCQLGDNLQRLPLRVCSVHVRRKAFTVFHDESHLEAVTEQLPAHIRSLIFEHEGRWASTFSEVERTWKLLPPLSHWTLPDGLTVLHLPRCLWLDKAGQGAAVQLPPRLVELRLGSELNHSLAKLKLPASLRVLQFGENWDQPASDWPLLPDELEALVLPQWFNHPLSSLRLPSSLRKLHFQSYRNHPGGAYQKVSRLFVHPTPNMFPPQLLSLQLPPPLIAEQEARQEEQLRKEGIAAVLIRPSTSPLNLSLLPPSLRFLRIHHAQPLVCGSSSALASMCLDQLRVFRGCAFPAETRFHGAEICRQRLRQQLQCKANGSAMRLSATISGFAAVAAASTAAAPQPTAAASASTTVAPPAFTLDTSKRR